MLHWSFSYCERALPWPGETIVVLVRATLRGRRISSGKLFHGENFQGNKADRR